MSTTPVFHTAALPAAHASVRAYAVAGSRRRSLGATYPSDTTIACARTPRSIAAPTGSSRRHVPIATTRTSDHAANTNQTATARTDHRSGAFADVLALITGTDTTVTDHANAASPAAATPRATASRRAAEPGSDEPEHPDPQPVRADP